MHGFKENWYIYVILPIFKVYCVCDMKIINTCQVNNLNIAGKGRLRIYISYNSKMEHRVKEPLSLLKKYGGGKF